MPQPLPAGLALRPLPPQDAVDYMARRGVLTPTFDWRDLWQEEHTRAFTVAKMLRQDLLGSVYDAVTRAVTEGRTFRQFASELGPLLVREGWWGKREMTDPVTGDTRLVQLGSLDRLRTIYEANIRSAYAAGRWASIERGRRVNPYIVYRTMRDARVRASHAAWDGVALPIDHPWWRTHYPPNGWRCRCIAYAIDERGLDRLAKTGLRIRRDAPDLVQRQWVNARTGEVIETPVGIDPGWAHNPGQVSRTGQAAQMQATSQSALAARMQIALRAIGTAAAAPPAAGWTRASRIADAARDLSQRFGVLFDLGQPKPHPAFGQRHRRADMLDTLNMVGEELARLAAAGYPALARGVRILEFGPARNSYGTSTQGALGNGDRLVAIAGQNFLAPVNLNAHGIPFSVKHYSASVEEGRRCTLRHEIAHCIGERAVRQALAALDGTPALGGLPMNQWAFRNLSSYAGTNLNECLSEILARYLAPNYVRGTLPPEIEEIAEKAAQRQYPGQ